MLKIELQIKVITLLMMGEDVRVDDNYLEDLEEWIQDEDKVVTYKFLSRNLKVHVNVAKQMLFNYVDIRKSSGSHQEKDSRKSSKLGVVYLVSGLVPR